MVRNRVVWVVLGGLIGQIILTGVQLDTSYTDKTLKYASAKNLGAKSGNGNMGVLLVAEISDSELYSNTGINGRIYLSRGSKGYFLISNFIDVTCMVAYQNTSFHVSNDTLKCGKCTYNGKTYIALQLGSDSLCDVIFSGFFTTNCTFIHALDTEVSWL